MHYVAYAHTYIAGGDGGDAGGAAEGYEDHLA